MSYSITSFVVVFLAVALSITCAMSLSFVLIDQESDTLFSLRGRLDKENFISIADRYSFTLPHHSSYSSAHNPIPIYSLSVF